MIVGAALVVPMIFVHLAEFIKADVKIPWGKPTENDLQMVEQNTSMFFCSRHPLGFQMVPDV
jgi:hypothetical protein